MFWCQTRGRKNWFSANENGWIESGETVSSHWPDQHIDLLCGIDLPGFLEDEKLRYVEDVTSSSAAAAFRGPLEEVVSKIDQFRKFKKYE